MATENERKRGRSSKTVLQQYQLYVNLLQSDVYFRENAFHPGEGSDALKLKWENLVKDLNSSGGPSKDLKTWKRTFSNWKCSVRAKARVIKKSYRETGNTLPPEVPLSSLEEKLLLYTGNVVVEGMNVPELGIIENPIFPEQTILGPVPGISGVFANNVELIDRDEEVQLPMEPPRATSTAARMTTPTTILTATPITTPTTILTATPTTTPIISGSSVPLPRSRRYNTLQSQCRLLTSTDCNNAILKSIDDKLESLVVIEKERLDCEKERLACEKDRLIFEKFKFSFKYPEFNMEDE